MDEKFNLEKWMADPASRDAIEAVRREEKSRHKSRNQKTDNRPREKDAPPRPPVPAEPANLNRKARHSPNRTNPAPPSSQPTIRVTPGQIHKTATEAEEALIRADAPFYSRGGQLVRPIVEEVTATRGFKTLVTRARPVSPDCMIDHMSRAAQFERYDARSKKFVRVDPPHAVAATVLSRDGEWSFRPLAGLITTPTLRPDGTLLSTPGYDPATRLLLLEPPPLPPIPDRPTRAEAEAALLLLKGLIEEFSFANKESRAVALSGLITPVVRGAMAVAPLHAVNAPSAGSGKSYLVDLCCALATGQRSAGIAAGRDEAETEKRLVGCAITADQIISIDNCNGELGGDFLCQLVERPLATARILGGNGADHMRRIENRTTVFANGNNITPLSDIVRRTLMCSLDTNMEKPYEREFKDNPLNRILAGRGKYIAACLTIVRAYLASGQRVKVTPLVSYEEWARMVQEPLVWLGEADPVKTIDDTREEDPELVLLATVMVELQKLLGGDLMTVGDIKDAACEREDEQSSFDGGRYGRPPSYRRPELRETLLTAAGIRGEIDSPRLGGFLKRYKGRIVAGMKLVADQDRNRKQQTWGIQMVRGPRLRVVRVKRVVF
jgi:putative DNA primase/helicase